MVKSKRPYTYAWCICTVSVGKILYSGHYCLNTNVWMVTSKDTGIHIVVPHLPGNLVVLVTQACKYDCRRQAGAKYKLNPTHTMTSSNGSIYCVTGPLCVEFTGDRWIPHTEASDAELWCFLWFAPWINGWVNNREAGDLRCHRTLYDVFVMQWL